jgi:hypothetical protein
MERRAAEVLTLTQESRDSTRSRALVRRRCNANWCLHGRPRGFAQSLYQWLAISVSSPAGQLFDKFEHRLNLKVRCSRSRILVSSFLNSTTKSSASAFGIEVSPFGLVFHERAAPQKGFQVS